ncbi:MAG: hypothetical protein HKN44_15035 [Ilumatobacter sp.]|nr:hypothetical protein [Ilumatobacter sp.]
MRPDEARRGLVELLQMADSGERAAADAYGAGRLESRNVVEFEVAAW